MAAMMEDETVDARGLACPQPVILAKKALDTRDRVKVLVDNETALENVKRLGAKEGCDVQVEERPDSTFLLSLSKKAGASSPDSSCAVGETPKTGPFVVVCSDNRMGRGPDELGQILMRSFLHTLAEQPEKPNTMVFYNAGVQLTVKSSPVLDDLQTLANAGVEILVCGTCVNYFGIGPEVAVGTVSNMYDIAGAMSRSGRLVVP